MINAAIVNFCKCCMMPADLCPNHPPPELQYEVEVKLPKKYKPPRVGEVNATYRTG